MEFDNKYSNVWEATDGSGLVFNCDRQPEKIRVVLLESSNGMSLPVYEIRLASLKHVRSVTCHDRLTGLGKVTWGSNTSYTVCHLDDGPYDAGMVIARMSGFGPQFFCCGGRTRRELFDGLCQFLTEHQLWDLLDLLVRTHQYGTETAKAAEFRRLAEAFVGGRLVKRKVRGKGQFEVAVKPVPPTPNPDGSISMQIGLGPIPGIPALVT
ncbi:MAG: hypothetical protein AMXMBFR13_06710 [Phycisphaerae bacterium]